MREKNLVKLPSFGELYDAWSEALKVPCERINSVLQATPSRRRRRGDKKGRNWFWVRLKWNEVWENVNFEHCWLQWGNRVIELRRWVSISHENQWRSRENLQLDKIPGRRRRRWVKFFGPRESKWWVIVWSIWDLAHTFVGPNDPFTYITHGFDK